MENSIIRGNLSKSPVKLAVQNASKGQIENFKKDMSWVRLIGKS